MVRSIWSTMRTWECESVSSKVDSKVLVEEPKSERSNKHETENQTRLKLSRATIDT